MNQSAVPQQPSGAVGGAPPSSTQPPIKAMMPPPSNPFAQPPNANPTMPTTVAGNRYAPTLPAAAATGTVPAAPSLAGQTSGSFRSDQQPGSGAQSTSQRASAAAAAAPSPGAGRSPDPRATAGTRSYTSTSSPLSSVPLSGSTAERAPSQSGSAASTTKNMAILRRVNKLLDITVNDSLKDLVLYVDEAVPDYFSPAAQTIAAAVVNGEGGSSAAAAGGGADSGAPPSVDGRRASSVPSSTNAGAPSAVALRSALEGRVIDMHKGFLKEFTALYETYQEATSRVQTLQQQCTHLEGALQTRAQEADAFVRRVSTLQTELQMVQQREREVREFKEKCNFGAEEQRVLDEEPVDVAFLDVVERAREVHRKSRSLLLSREYQQSASAVMESTYTAIMKATEKIARYLLSLSSASGLSSAGGGGGGGGSSGIASYSAMSSHVAAMSADVPEVSSFYLRCVQVLREENPTQWAKVTEQVARLRRASVLRRYFHLLTTGSATTSTGTYQGNGTSSAATAAAAAAGTGDGLSGARPLEAELNNPVVFFSALFAWLHQTIVDEDDFISLFFGTDKAAADAAADAAAAAAAASADANGKPTSADAYSMTSSYAVTAERLGVTRRKLLDFVFGGVCKHVQAALDGVLERFLRSTSNLNGAGGGGGGSGGGSGAGGGLGDNGEGGVVSSRVLGPRGITGGLTRLLFAATGRPMPGTGAGMGGSGAGGDGFALVQRYSNVTTRTQQESLVAVTLGGLLQGLQTCFTLLQLFQYYSAATFMPLLGPQAELTELISETAGMELLRVFHDLVKLVSQHLFDSVAGAVYRLAVLRRLSSAYAMDHAAQQQQPRANSVGSGGGGGGDRVPLTVTGTTDPSKPGQSSESKLFVLDFLMAHSVVDGSAGSGVGAEDLSEVNSFAVDGAGGGSGAAAAATPHTTSIPSGGLSTASHSFRYSGNAEQQSRASATELNRALQQLILPPSPELQACLRVLHHILLDTERQQHMLTALQEQQRREEESGGGASAAASGDPSAAHDPALTSTTEKPELYFTVLVQPLLSVSVLMAQQPTIHNALDDPCQRVMELNAYAALESVLAAHEAYIATVLPDSNSGSSSGTEAASTTASPSRSLRAVVEEKEAALIAVITRLMQQAASKHYFPTGESAAAKPGDPAAQAGRVRGLLRELHSFYNTIAASGRLPGFPLLSTIANATQRSATQADVSRFLFERYAAQYAEVVQLTSPPPPVAPADGGEPAPVPSAVVVSLSNEETSLLADLAPNKLSLLVDTKL